LFHISILPIKQNLEMDFENMDAQTVISDITETTSNSDGDESFPIQKLAINTVFENELNKLNHDYLKEKCRQNGISISKLKKPELILALIRGFDTLWGVLKEKKMEELRSICKDLNLKGIAGVKKDGLILMIMTQNANCKSTVFVCQPETSVGEKRRLNEQQQQQELEVERLRQEAESERLRQQEAEAERIRQQEAEAERIRQQEAESERLRQQEAEAERIRQQEELRQKEQADAERLRKLEEETKISSKPIDGEKRKKQNIPKSVKTHVWDLYIGSHINEHRCICCKKTLIKVTYFDVGHVIAEKNGGTLEISNLRPICSVCNYSMGTENMVDFVKKYGYYIG
jgi:HNH endonuclease/Rho termination factor, N-terminal domain